MSLRVFLLMNDWKHALYLINFVWFFKVLLYLRIKLKLMPSLIFIMFRCNLFGIWGFNVKFGGFNWYLVNFMLVWLNLVEIWKGCYMMNFVFVLHRLSKYLNLGVDFFVMVFIYLFVCKCSTPDYITPDNQNLLNGFDCNKVM